MNAVIYVSKGGNTGKLAEAIARGAGVKACPAASAGDLTQVDILFIGGSIYGGRISGELRRFLRDLKVKQPVKVVVFGTSVSGRSALPEVTAILEAGGVPVSGEAFCCKGSFLWANPGCPNAGDLARAEDFAKRVCGDGR
jgi:flavodoxin